MDRETVLITGGSGYLGSRLAQAVLLQPGLHLRLGIHPPGMSPPGWMKGIESVPLNALSDTDVKSACRGVQYVVHLAALNQNDCEANPEQALLVNSLGTLKVLLAAQSERVKRFIYFSTAHVYGSPLIGALTEKSLPRPVHPYAITHRAAEDFVLGARNRGLVSGIVLRLSNGFGAPVHPEINQWTLIGNDLCRQAVTSRKLVLKTSGLQHRDWVCLSDVCRAVIHLLSLSESACEDGLFNLGGECSLSIIDLAERIVVRCKEVLGFVPEISRPVPSSAEISPPIDYRIDKLKATGFVLRGDMNEEIDATLRFCRSVFGKAA